MFIYLFFFYNAGDRLYDRLNSDHERFLIENLMQFKMCELLQNSEYTHTGLKYSYAEFLRFAM